MSSAFDGELRRQIAQAQRMIRVAHDDGDEFTAAAYHARVRDLEEIAVRCGAGTFGGAGTSA